MSDHEHSDVHVKAIALSSVGLAVFLASVMGVSVALARFFGPARQEETQARVMPPYQGPLLQVQPEQELADSRAADRLALDQYAWEDQPAGVVRLPIEAAMRLLVQRGLPAPASAPVTFEELQRQRGAATP